jgi:hypothetical protein
MYMADATAAASLSPGAPLVLPANTPPQAAQQVWQNVLNQAIQNQTGGTTAPEVAYSNVNAVIESTSSV